MGPGPASSPGEGDAPVGVHEVVVVLREDAHQAEVADLDDLAAGQEHVAGRQVAVDEVAALQVLHARSDLRGKQPQARQREVVLPQPQRVVQRAQWGQLRHLRSNQTFTSHLTDTLSKEMHFFRESSETVFGAIRG